MEKETQSRMEIEDRELWYGWWNIKPRFLQCLNNLKFYMLNAVILYVVFGFVSGWVGTGIQEIEKQFGLSSSVSATLATALNLGNSCTVIFIGYIGTKVNKAKGLAIGMTLFGVGLILNSLPHFLLDPYQPTAMGPGGNATSPGHITSICPHNASSGGFRPQSKGDNHMAYFSLLLVGQVLSGLGSTFVYTLGLAYLDDNAPVGTAAVLIGTVSTVSTIGGALSALVGGPIIEYLYVDFDRVDTNSLPFGPGDPQWVGAWWIGFLVGGLVLIFISLPLSGFPRILPSTPPDHDQNAEKKEEERAASLPRFLKKTFLDFFKAFFKLIFDIEYMCICIAYSIEGVAMAGMSTFGFKFVTNEYGLGFDVAGYVLGTKAIIGSGGYILAGLVIKWFQLDLVGMERACTIFLLTAVILGLSLFLGCSNINMVGIETPYPGGSSTAGLLSECQGQCQCEGQPFNPVCANGGHVYFSPCHAGCQDITEELGVKMFTNCSCVALTNNVSLDDVKATVTSGTCDVACWETYLVLACLFLVFILIISCSTFSSVMVFRCVDQKLKPFALGITTVLARVIGSIPSPLVIGRIVDSACLVWSDPQEAGGRYCQMYDKHWLTTGIAIMWLVAGLVSVTFMCLALVVNRWKKRRAERRKTKAENT